MSALDKALALRRGAMNIGQPEPQKKKKSAGGGLTSAMGGAATGASLSAIPALAQFAPALIAGGALIGGAEYFFS